MIIQEQLIFIKETFIETFDLPTILFIILLSVCLVGIVYVLSIKSNNQSKKFTDTMKVGDKAHFSTNPLIGEITEINDKFVYVKIKIHKRHLFKHHEKDINFDKKNGY